MYFIGFDIGTTRRKAAGFVDAGGPLHGSGGGEPMGGGGKPVMS